jgi:tetratricopeptide (TPR) repeat protein
MRAKVRFLASMIAFWFVVATSIGTHAEVATSPTVQQISRGSCSPPILNNNGTINLTCADLDADATEQLEKQLAELLPQLRQTLADRSEDFRTIRNQNDLIGILREQADDWATRYRDLSSRVPNDEAGKRARELIKTFQFDEAEKLLKEEATKEQPDVSRAASTQYDLGSIALLKFDWEAAFPYFLKAFNYEPSNSKYADLMGTSAYIAKQYSEAERGMKAALELYGELAKSKPEFYQPYIAPLLHNLGNLYGETDRGEDALAKLNQSVAMRREIAKRDPAERVALASTLIDLAKQLEDSKKSTKEAERDYKEAIAIYREVNNTSPEVGNLADAINSLGVFYYENDRPSDAVRCYLDAIEIRGKLPRSLDTAMEMNFLLLNLGLAYDDLKQRTNAEKAYLDGVKAIQDVGDKTNTGDYILSRSFVQLADHYAKFGQNIEAEKSYLEVINIRREMKAREPVLGGLVLTDALGHLFEFYEDQKRFKDAEGPLNEALSLSRELRPQNEQFRVNEAKALGNLGVLKHMERDEVAAAGFFRDALQIFQEQSASNPELGEYVEQIKEAINEVEHSASPPKRRNRH